MTTKNERIARYYASMSALGFTWGEANKIRLIEKTLHRWAELECGDGNDYASWAIERDETTGKPYMVTYPHTGKTRRYRVSDREAGAIRRLEQIMGGHSDLWYYQQTDPRGVALYIGRKSDTEGLALESYYTRGLAISAK